MSSIAFAAAGSPRMNIALTAAALLLAGCGGADAPGTDAGGDSDAIVYEGGRLIVGDGTVIDDAVFVVEGGRFTQVGTPADVQVPSGATRVDVAGKTVMPAIVNAHVHLPSGRRDRTELLQHMAYYGAGTVVSLGHDEGDAPFAMRDEVIPGAARSLTAGRGITSEEPGRTEVPFWVTTEAAARSAVQEEAASGVDIVKIWVDDRNGRYDKLTPALYGPIIDEAHQHGLKVTAHIFTLADAKGLLSAGIDAFAHSVRDQDIDDEIVSLWLDRPNVVLVPNLGAPGVAMDLSWLSETVPAETLQEMQQRSTDRPAAQEAFGIQARNLARLNTEGVTIAFGTDGESPWAVHLEMEDMVRSGMTPAQVLVAATGTSADFMSLTDVGVVEVGRSADFIVLDANPLDDITNTRLIDAVYLRGDEVDRDAVAVQSRRRR